MDEPPPGNYRAIMQTYARHTAEIWAKWDEIHGR